MMRDRRGGRGIDITPLIDMMFMLIIFFVLTSEFVRGSITIDLPQGDPPHADKRNPIVVTVMGDSEILWGGESVTRAALPPLVAEALARSDDLLVAGDRSASYGDVAETLDLLRSLGIERVNLAFEPGGTE